jgi:cytochrome bd-type quinol oxidase subunit 1
LTVISVNGWMNHPTGFRFSHSRVADVHPLGALFVKSYFWHELDMYLAGYMVTGFVLAGAYAFGRLRGRWGRYEPERASASERCRRRTVSARTGVPGVYYQKSAGGGRTKGTRSAAEQPSQVAAPAKSLLLARFRYRYDPAVVPDGRLIPSRAGAKGKAATLPAATRE